MRTKGPIQHGTPSGYSHGGCRCEECRAAVALYQRQRFQAKKKGTWVPGRYEPELRTCGVADCDKVARYYQPEVLCTGHYQQKRARGDVRSLGKKRFATATDKQCSKCEQVLPLDQFHRQKNRVVSKCKACTSIYTRANKYGLTFDEMAELLGGDCAGCGESVRGREQHVDHDHDTGRVRGVLCHNCNTVLTIHVTPTILRRLADYLERG